MGLGGPFRGMVFYPLCSNGCLFCRSSAYIAVISFLPEADP